MVNVEANESIGSPKRKDPLSELQSPKGGFLRLAACQSLSPWERWHCEAMTERASPAGKSRGRSDRQAFCQSDTIAVPMILGQQPSPLSLVALLLASSPKGGAIGMSVSFRLDAESPTGRKRAGLAAKASGFWTTHLVKLSLAQTAEHYRSRDIVLCSSSRKWPGLPKPPPLGELSRPRPA